MTPQPLSEEEFDSLSEVLERLGGRAMNLEQLDGFLASLVCGPEDVSQTECVQEVCGFEMARAYLSFNHDANHKIDHIAAHRDFLKLFKPSLIPFTRAARVSPTILAE